MLLNSYVEWGDKCIEFFRGMFSFVIWNKKEKQIKLFRDWVGIKPLFYIEKKDMLVISSEIKSILNFFPEEKIINEKAIFKFLSKGWCDDDNSTFFKNIKSVPPSSITIFDSKKSKTTSFWKIKNFNKNKFNSEIFLKQFFETVNYHLVSDVPIAFTLSGGMDSSSILATVCKLVKSVKNLKVFSVIPPNTVDETKWINDTVKFYNVNHSYLDISNYDLIKIFDEVVDAHDEPFLKQLYLSIFIKKRNIKLGFKVLIVGEGGDEVLGGYKRMIYPYLYNLKSKK